MSPTSPPASFFQRVGKVPGGKGSLTKNTFLFIGPWAFYSKVLQYLDKKIERQGKEKKRECTRCKEQLLIATCS